MGKPITRLNPQVESSIQRIFLNQILGLLHFVVMVLPKQQIIKSGPKPYDYRKILLICVLRVLLRKTYADYEIEMRNDSRICIPLGYNKLPGKSTIQRGMNLITMDLLRKVNSILISEWIKRRLNIYIDASGIRIVGRSIWYSLRTKKNISRRECDKVHLAICGDTMLALNWFITNGKQNDCPFFERLLAPFKLLGIILADKGYLSRKNFQIVADKNGSAFIPFKSNSGIRSKSNPAWKFALNLWKLFPMIYKSIYNQRSKVECVFSVLKKRYGDNLHSRDVHLRRREFALRLISYNLRLIICLKYAKEHDIPCWVRAKR